MGLDMFAYSTQDKNVNSDFSVKNIDVLDEFFYWRKHPNLHGWFEKLHMQKGGDKEFNCQYVRITIDDILELESTIKNKSLPYTKGFFFGESCEEFIKDDLTFISKAKEILKKGQSVFYSSWW
jgi:hypothetical protein